jgi:hypothetical protein
MTEQKQIDPTTQETTLPVTNAGVQPELGGLATSEVLEGPKRYDPLRDGATPGGRILDEMERTGTSGDVAEEPVLTTEPSQLSFPTGNSANGLFERAKAAADAAAKLPRVRPGSEPVGIDRTADALAARKAIKVQKSR